MMPPFDSLRFRFYALILMLASLFGSIALGAIFRPYAANILMVGMITAFCAFLLFYASKCVAGNHTTLLPYELHNELSAQYNIKLIGVDGSGAPYFRMPWGYSVVRGTLPGHNLGFTPELTVYDDSTDPQPVVHVVRSAHELHLVPGNG